MQVAFFIVLCMAKIQLELPGQFIYSTQLSVRTGDVNSAGHLGNDAVLTLVQEAGFRFLKHHGFTIFNIYGYGLIQADAVIVYKSQAFHGDKLKFEIELGDFSRSSFDFYYLITNTQTNQEVARVKTRMVFFDYDKKETVSVPVAFREKFA